MMNKQNSGSGWAKKPTQSTATEQLKEAVKTDKTRPFTFNISVELHKKFKLYATNNDTNMTDILIDYIITTVNK
jgi:hypothetical protein